MRIALDRLSFKFNLKEMVMNSKEYTETKPSETQLNKFLMAQSLGLDDQLTNLTPKLFDYMGLSLRLKFDKKFRELVINQLGQELKDTIGSSSSRAHNYHFQEAMLDGNSFDEALDYADMKTGFVR